MSGEVPAQRLKSAPRHRVDSLDAIGGERRAHGQINGVVGGEGEGPSLMRSQETKLKTVDFMPWPLLG